MAHAIRPTGVECILGDEELIVSKTNLKGHITYANDVFLRLSKYPVKEIIGAPHSVIRHPEMPRCIFKLLWDTIGAKHEIFAYVVNLAADGGHYWVFAHVTPTLDAQGNILGFHSNRRKPDRAQVERIKPLYAQIVAEENRHPNRKDGMLAGYDMLMGHLQKQGIGYDQFVLSL